MPAGQVNFRGHLPHSASNALEPMLHTSNATQPENIIDVFLECHLLSHESKMAWTGPEL